MKILGWIIATPFIILALYVLLRFAFCRPNYFTVKIATPMVKKISDYIVEYGIPESLDEIPDLPYELKGCERKIVYWTSERPRKIVKDRQRADYAVVTEKCYSLQDNNNFHLSLAYTDGFDMARGELDIVSKKTTVGTSFESADGKKYIFSDIGTSFDQRFGFCRQFKQ